MDGSKGAIRGEGTGRQGAKAGGSAGTHGGGSRVSAHGAQSTRTGAGDQHERSAKDTYGSHVSRRDADPAACCSTVEQIKWPLGVRMGSNGMQEGWKVSEVERLIGLPRRDIQRACYEGAGGAGILSPADSSWGRRLYSKDDLLTLFMVKQERDQDLSLPEIKRLFEEKEGEPGGRRRFVDDQVARMRDEFEDAAWRLASAEALRAATRGEEDDENEGEAEGESAEAEAVEGAGEAGSNNTALDGVIDRILLLGVLEIMEDGGVNAGNAAGTNERTTVSSDPGRAHQTLHELWQKLADCRVQGCAADAPETQAVVGGALADLEDASDAQTAASRLGRLLDAPGMELALELRHGPGAYAYIRDAVDTFAAEHQEDPDAQAHANK